MMLGVACLLVVVRCLNVVACCLLYDVGCYVFVLLFAVRSYLLVGFILLLFIVCIVYMCCA